MEKDNKKADTITDMQGESKKIDTSNIFDDFTDDNNLKEEIKEIVENQERDIFYYIQKVKTILQFLIVLLLLFVFWAYSYIYIQKNENLSNSTIIDPICFFILWDIINTNTYCSSVESLSDQYSKEVIDLKNKQISNINFIFESVYKLENFLESKEVIFLKNKTDSKLDIMWIISEFDSLINEFEPIEKEKIDCYDMEISSNNTIKINCEVYGAWYDKYIKWFDWTSDTFVWGTSISYANSFINYIKKQSTKFFIVNEPKIFSSTPVSIDNKWFTEKTKFTLDLKFNSDKYYLNY